ncbi:YhhN domain-containing protein [Paracoccidioides lutzii Pb01]|uniref:YhhN domain-containing protein n=1 Tax=Paracoccidioides lutzii (strain ATCC MYA-826 / Pb01) TaxID=502779 RepID=C1HBA8_PARBA|nr:YhhN domain-containing protein [Paracoccidioides lutzii Pb01]EEH37631.1 YhhN domain-containing protein [Paracoccidioides lutzii Pb01]
MPTLSTLLPPFLSTLSLPPPQSTHLLNISLPLLVLSERFSFYPGSYIFKLLSSAAFLAGPLYYLAPSSPFQLRQWNPYHLRIAAGLVFSAVGDYCLIPTRTAYYDKHLGVLHAARKHSSASKRAEEEVVEEEEEEEEVVVVEEEETPRKISKSFRAGVAAFAAAHISYALAFLHNTTNRSSTSTQISWPIFTATFGASMLLAKITGVIYPPRNTKSKSKSKSKHASSLANCNLLNLSIADDMRPLVLGYSAIISGMLAVAASTSAAAGGFAPAHQRLLGAVMFVASDLFVARDAFGKGDEGHPGWLKPSAGFGLYFWAQMLIAGTV